MIKKNVIFCPECREESTYKLKIEKCKKIIKEKDYEFSITRAYCLNCDEKINVPGLIDLNNREIDEQYRKYESIVTIEDINDLMSMYLLGKSTLSLVLGFGEITITRYLEGQIPSNTYSDIIRKAMTSPEYMLQLLNQNKDKLTDVAYKKAYSAVNKMIEVNSLSDAMNDIIHI